MHALEPIKYALPVGQVLVLSKPTVCMGALWLPYRRDLALMKQILAEACRRPDVGIVFCHADVVGAVKNNGFESTEGIALSSFPPNVPIYSGHFHKPHQVRYFYSLLISILRSKN